MLAPWSNGPRWEEITKKLADPVTSLLDLDGRMAYLQRPSLPSKKVFERLKRYFDGGHFDEKILLETVIPTVDRLIVSAPETFRDKPLHALPQDQSGAVSYSRPQVATLIAMMWYGLFDYDYGGDYIAMESYFRPSINKIWDTEQNFALDCVLNYFVRISSITHDYEFDYQTVIYRRHRGEEIGNINARTPQILLGNGDSDDSIAPLHISGATTNNSRSAFESTLTHEDIVMLTRPECLLLLLIAPGPDYARCNVVIGAEKMASYSGTGSAAKFIAPLEESLEIVTNSRYSIYRTANVFAPPSAATATHAQYIANFADDVAQLRWAMESAMLAPGGKVAFGNWSHENSGSPPQLRVIQACIAAGIAQLDLCLYVADPVTKEKLPEFAHWLSTKTTLEVFNLYNERIHAEWNTRGVQISGLDLFKLLMA